MRCLHHNVPARKADQGKASMMRAISNSTVKQLFLKVLQVTLIFCCICCPQCSVHYIMMTKLIDVGGIIYHPITKATKDVLD